MYINNLVEDMRMPKNLIKCTKNKVFDVQYLNVCDISTKWQDTINDPRIMFVTQATWYFLYFQLTF
jgi:hypothetical protein